MMGDVYKNAVITIAAAASCDSNTGIFDVLEEKGKYYGALKLHPDSSACESVQVSTFKGEEIMEDPMFHLPLATRGWALQERIFSQRVHYGRRGIYWQCRTAHLSADGNSPRGRAALYIPHGALLKLPQILTSANRPSQIRKIHDVWLSVVESYCSYRRLSFATDKLPAMAGIASTIQELTGGVYLAGIWKEDFMNGLLWQTWKDPRRVKHRAPSWSWARWDGYVTFVMSQYETSDDDLLAQLLQCHIQPSGDNPFGEVSSGSLHMRGWTTIRTIDKIAQLGGLRLDGYSWTPYMKDIVSSFGNTEYTVMLIGSFSWHTLPEVPPEISKIGMLVLKPVDGESNTIFERIGIVTHYGHTFDMTGRTRQELTII